MTLSPLAASNNDVLDCARGEVHIFCCMTERRNSKEWWLTGSKQMRAADHLRVMCLFCFSYLTGCLGGKQHFGKHNPKAAALSIFHVIWTSVFKAQLILFLRSSLASFSSVFWLLAWPTPLLFAVHSQRYLKPRLQLFLIVKALKIRLHANCAAPNSSRTKLKLKHVNTVELLAAKFWAKYFPHELV